MSEGNPLIAAPVETTNAVTGIGIAESSADLASGIANGSWVEAGLGAAGVGLEVLSLAIDPVGTLLSYGVGWIIEHFQPLKEALDWLAGDPPVIQSFSETWANVAVEVEAISQEFLTEVNGGTAGWTGQAADNYRTHSAETADALAGASELASGISTGVMIMGQVVAAVRELVRELIAWLVGKLIAWAAELAASLGFAAPAVITQAITTVTQTINKVSGFLRKLIKTIGNVSPLLRKIVTKLDEIIGKLATLMRRADAPTTPSSASRVADDIPTTRVPDGPTTPSSSTTTPDTPTTPSRAGDTPTTRSPESPTSPDGAETTPSGTQSPDGRPGDGSPDGRLRDNTSSNPHDTAEQPAGRCGRREPVDMATGEMYMVQRDVDLPGVLPLVLERVHVSSYRSGRSFGPSWASTVDQRIEIDKDGVCYAGPDGVILVYPHPAPGAEVLPAAGARWPLRVGGDGGYTIAQAREGRTLHFSPATNGAAYLSAVVDRNDNRIDLVYNESGLLSEVRHSGGYTIAASSARGRITGFAMRNRDGTDVPLLRYEYDDAGHLAAVINSSGRPMRFRYDAAGRITRWDDRKGQWYAYTYDVSGRCVRTEGSGDALAGTMTYDVVARETRETNSLGAVSVYRFDSHNKLISETDPLGNVTRYEWDAADRLVSQTDPLGRTTRYAYDDAENLVRTTLPNGGEVLFEYNELRQPVSLTEPDGARWRNVYDARGNLVESVDPLGAVTRYERDQRGAIARRTNALGATEMWRADAAGLPVAVTDSRGVTTGYQRDLFGRVSAIVDAEGGVTRLRWTIEGKLAALTRPDGATEAWHHDPQGAEVRYVDALGQATEVRTTHFDLPAVEIGRDGARTEFRYDSEMRLVSVLNPNGLEWRYTYDEAGRPTSETDFNGRTVHYVHDAAGWLVERTNGARETVRLTRDEMGNIVERRSGDAVSTFSFDPIGRMTRATNADADVVFQRDRTGCVLVETINGNAVTSSYDPLGRRVKRTTPSGRASQWRYDTAGWLESLSSGTRTIVFGHDRLGREVSREFDTGVTITQAWDLNSRLVAQTVAHRDAGQVQQRRFRYRPDSHLVSVQDGMSDVRDFELDPVGRVTTVRGSGWQERYTYDASGAISFADVPRQGDGDDYVGVREYSGTRVRRAGVTTFAYDEQGRMVHRRRQRLSHKPDVWHYTWDPEDRLISVRTPDGETWSYRYDALGRRIAKERLSAAGMRAERVDFTWDGDSLAEQSTSDGYVTTWDWTPDGDRPLTQVEWVRLAPQEWVDEQFYGIVTDAIGTPTELLDEQGRPAWQSRTVLWGQSLSDTRQRAYTPLRFPGQYFDQESGLSYNYFRYYDPGTARYLSADPIGLAGGDDNHAYVPHPLTWRDPLGLERKWYHHSDGWTLARDMFPAGQGTDFEFHVIHNGQEVGFFGSNGWFSKHGLPIPEPGAIPPHIEGRLKNLSIDIMRNQGRLPAQGRTDLSDDKWKRPRIGACDD